MQLHDILLLRTSAILPEAISAGGLTPTTDTSLFLTTYRGGSHLSADILDSTLFHHGYNKKSTEQSVDFSDSEGNRTPDSSVRG